jgi:outer membrane biosynthesis protein TonB
VPKTETVPREQISKLQPSRPIEQAAQAQEEAKPKPALAPGDLALAKPEDVRRPSEGDAEKGRPRTIKEALARKSANRIPGEEMKQDGGVKRIGIVPSFDTKATQFGAYDAAFIEAVSQRWFDLLDSRDYSFDRRGRVVLQFQLNHDGRITDMNVMENTVGEVLSLICQKAVLDPAPFERWSSDMRRMFGETRKIQFAFYYN